jgi:hypothetical protein
MSFRAKASAVAFTAAICTLLAPAAMAAPGPSHAPAQVTGKQLKNGLLPPSHFLPGYVGISSFNSGGALERGTAFHIPSMGCVKFWSFIGTVAGFGENAFAEQTIDAKSVTAPVQENFQQTVYQAASNKAAATLFGQISARYKSCKSVSYSDDNGGRLKRTVRARTTERVGGHQSLLLTETLSDSRIGGPAVLADALWTLDGTDVYLLSSQLLNVTSPKPALSSLMLELISRVRALK